MSVKKSEFESDRICEESDGCPTEGAVLKRFWRANQPDKGLCDFYEASDYPSLVRELVGHVAQLQDAARRNVKPWEDTMPPTLLPAHIERLKKADDDLRAKFTEPGDVIREMNDEMVDLRTRLAKRDSLLLRLHPHVRGCSAELWSEFNAALSAAQCSEVDPQCSEVLRTQGEPVEAKT